MRWIKCFYAYKFKSISLFKVKLISCFRHSGPKQLKSYLVKLFDMKGIFTLVLGLVLIISTQFAFSQANHNHGRFDEVFGPWTLSKVVETSPNIYVLHTEYDYKTDGRN